LLRLKIGQDDFNDEDVDACADALKRGCVLVMPTDTVYGIAALASDAGAVGRVMRIKERAEDKPLPVQAASVADANVLGVADSPVARALISEFWPGGLTIVLERRQGVDLPYQAGPSIGVRVPGSRFCLAVIERAGRLVVPSANGPGEPAPIAAGDVSSRIIDSVDLLVDAGACPGGTESTVVDITRGIEVLREGAVSRDRIMQAVRGLDGGS
jgi:L-threonylcarbamoyladenylate synthase